MGSGLQNLRGTPQLLMMAKGEKGMKDPLPFECFFAPFSKRKSPRNDFGGKLVDLSLKKAQHLSSRLVPSGLRSKHFRAVYSEQKTRNQSQRPRKKWPELKSGEGWRLVLVLFHAWPKTKIPFLVLSTETLVTQAMYPVAVYTSVKREKIR